MRWKQKLPGSGKGLELGLANLGQADEDAVNPNFVEREIEKKQGREDR